MSSLCFVSASLGYFEGMTTRTTESIFRTLPNGRTKTGRCIGASTISTTASDTHIATRHQNITLKALLFRNGAATSINRLPSKWNRAPTRPSLKKTKIRDTTCEIQFQPSTPKNRTLNGNNQSHANASRMHQKSPMKQRSENPTSLLYRRRLSDCRQHNPPDINRETSQGGHLHIHRNLFHC